MNTIFWLENLKGRDHSDDLDVNGVNIRMCVREVGLEDVDWIHLAQDMDQWRVLVNTVMNLQVPYKAENFLTS
jgi:hypothetical protein